MRRLRDILLVAAALTAMLWFGYDWWLRSRTCQSVLVVNTWVTWCQ